MQKKSTIQISGFVLLCILINFAGKQLAFAWNLPVWMDTFGTAMAAYALGPACGVMVGVSAHIIPNFSSPPHMVYAFAGAAIGLVVGLCTKRKAMESLFGIFTAGFLVTIASVAAATPINCLAFGGYTRNIWGNGVIDLLREHDIPRLICFTAGQFCVDFPDKVLSMFLLAGLVRLYRWRRTHKKSFIGSPLILPALILCLFSLAPTARAAEVDYNSYLQTVYNNGTGLPGGVANDVAQTDDGVLWVGTGGGLYRYSGREFQLVNEFKSIKNVNCFYVDDEGRLWIGTNDAGVSICIKNTIANVLDKGSGLPSNSVRCITKAADGSYYIGTAGALSIASLSDGLSVEESVPGVNHVKGLAADDAGHVAALVDGGVLYLLRGTEVLSTETCPQQNGTFTCCTFDGDGKMYVGTSNNEIYVYIIKDGRMYVHNKFLCRGVTNLNELKFFPDGNLMVCAYDGIGYLDADRSFHTVKASRFSSSICHALCDYQGNLWFTSPRLGLLKLCRSPFLEVYDHIGLRERLVNTITRWQEDYYFGTDRGLDVANGDLQRSLTNPLTKALDGIRIRCMLVDREDRLWICTAGQGVWRVEPDHSYTIYNKAGGAPEDWFSSAVELRDGAIALTGDEGITWIKDGRVLRHLQRGRDSAKPLCLLELGDGALLAGTDGSGVSIIRDGAVAAVLTIENGLSSNTVLRMVPDPAGKGVFLVTGNGLCFMDRDYQIRSLDSFPYYNNYDVTPGLNNELLVTGSAGIYVVDRDELVQNQVKDFKLLNSQKGLRATLTANAWNYVDSNGDLYLAVDNGVTVVNLAQYDITYRSYRMNLRSVLVDGERYAVRSSEAISIPRGARQLVLTPEIVNYSTSNPRVKVYLRGYDAEARVVPWSELGDSVYSNLPTGEYSYRVAILNDKGQIVSENDYPIVKEKEIYDEDWFMLYVAIIFVGAIVYVAWMLFRTQIQRTLNFQRRELELANRQLQMSRQSILTIARTVDAKDANTSQHSFRVSEYSVMIARRLGFSDEACEELRQTALLHDIGKIGIPDSVLNKPAKLTDEEYAVMKSHVVEGAKILKDFTSVDHIVEGALYHHERYDGKGYAKGLKGEEIPLYARIIGIADAFDAMTSNRVYRRHLDMDYVVGELRRCRGTQFDPKLADILLELIEDGAIQVEKLHARSREQTEGGAAV